MPRIITKTDQKPLEIKPNDKSVWICMCGLSKNEPYCDGSHNKTLDEGDKTYKYLPDGTRIEITE